MSVYKGIMQGLNETLEHERGNLSAKTVTITVALLPEISQTEIAEIRKCLNMPLKTFAAVMGVSVKTAEAWESGRSVPSGPARRLLAMLKADLQLIEKHNIFSVK